MRGATGTLTTPQEATRQLLYYSEARRLLDSSPTYHLGLPHYSQSTIESKFLSAQGQSLIFHLKCSLTYVGS